ncbi:hypothetical protein L7F22_002203 [Adiantum nelumboides]|nr:hypothetical protein [Adiantum nelumboides]
MLAASNSNRQLVDLREMRTLVRMGTMAKKAAADVGSTSVHSSNSKPKGTTLEGKSKTTSDKSISLPSRKAQYPKQKRFCYTQEELREEHGLSLEGKLYQHLGEADVTKEDWLSIFKKKREKGSKLFLHMMRLEYVEDCSGATKHITSLHDMFTSLESDPYGSSATCANNASYPMQGVGKIMHIAANGSSFTLVDALYVLAIKKNLLFVYALARLDLVVKFVNDRCTVHYLNFGDEIVASGILCCGLYKLTLYDKCGKNFANAVMDTKAILDAKLWHARFGLLNFSSLLSLQKSDMVASLPPLEAPVKHVCEGCILGKMQRSKFPKDGSIRATYRLQLVHSDVCGPM